MREEVNIRRSERVNVFHFLLGASKASFMPFFLVFAKTFGFTGVGASIIVALQLLMHAAAGALTVHFVRRSRRMKLILVSCLALMVVNYGVLLLIPLRNEILNCHFNESQAAETTPSPGKLDLKKPSFTPTPGAVKDDQENRFDVSLQQRILNLASHIKSLSKHNSTVSEASIRKMAEHLTRIQEMFERLRSSPRTTRRPILTTTAPLKSDVYERIGSMIQSLHHEMAHNLGLSRSLTKNFTLGKLSALMNELHAQISNLTDIRAHRQRRAAGDDREPLTWTFVWDPTSFRMNGEDPKVYVMIVMCILMISGSGFLAPIERSSDSLWFTILEGENESNNFGSHHLWSSIGYGMFGGTTGLIVHFVACQRGLDANHFFFHLSIFVILLTLTGVVSIFYPYDETHSEISWMMSKEKKRTFSDAWRLLISSNHTRLLLILTIVFGLLLSPLELFVFWPMVTLGVNEVVVGGVIFLRFCFEPFHLMLSIQLIRRITYNGLICLSLGLLALRFLLYSFLTASWQFLPIEILHSFITSAHWTCVYAYPDLIVDPVMDRKVQCLISTFYTSGYIVGFILSGVLYDYVPNTKFVYYGLAVITISWCILFGIIFRYLPHKQVFNYNTVLTHEPPDGESPHDSDDSEEEIELNRVKET